MAENEPKKRQGRPKKIKNVPPDSLKDPEIFADQPPVIIPPENIMDNTQIKDMKDKPHDFQLLVMMLESMTEPEIMVFVERCSKMAGFTIKDFEHYPDMVNIRPGIDIQKDVFFDVAVIVNTFLNKSPLNQNGY